MKVELNKDDDDDDDDDNNKNLHKAQVHNSIVTQGKWLVLVQITNRTNLLFS